MRLRHHTPHLVSATLVAIAAIGLAVLLGGGQPPKDALAQSATCQISGWTSVPNTNEYTEGNSPGTVFPRGTPITTGPCATAEPNPGWCNSFLGSCAGKLYLQRLYVTNKRWPGGCEPGASVCYIGELQRRTATVVQPTTCPSGQVGTPPNCTTPQCPSGQLGTYPNCYTPQCPAGQVGTYPNCTTPPNPTCPTGQVGTPPNCSTPSTPKCPTGYTGTYPNCVRPPSNGGGGGGGSGGGGSTTPITPAPSPNPGSGSSTAPPITSDPLVEIVDEPPAQDETNTFYDVSIETSIDGVVIMFSARGLTEDPEVIIRDRDGNPVELSLDRRSSEGDASTYRVTASELDANTTYTLELTGTNKSGEMITYDTPFITKGYPVVIVLMRGDELLSEADLTLSMNDRQSVFTTNEDGEISLSLGSGTLTANYDNLGAPISRDFTVIAMPIGDDGTVETQRFTFDINGAARANSGNPLILVVLSIFGAILLLGLVLFIIFKRKRDRENTGQFVPLTGDYGVDFGGTTGPVQLPERPAASPVPTITVPSLTTAGMTPDVTGMWPVANEPIQTAYNPIAATPETPTAPIAYPTLDPTATAAPAPVADPYAALPLPPPVPTPDLPINPSVPGQIYDPYAGMTQPVAPDPSLVETRRVHVNNLGLVDDVEDMFEAASHDTRFGNLR